MRKRTVHYRIQAIAKKAQVSIKDARDMHNTILTAKDKVADDKTMESYSIGVLKNINNYKLNK